jgi:recombination protein RecA
MTDSRTKPKSTSPDGADAKATDPKLEAARAERSRSLGAAMAEIEKSYGKGAIMRLGEGSIIKEIRGISSGSPSLDLALGGKGFPRGRIIEVFGPESSGKTTLALHVIANAQKEGGICAFVDAEHALDPAYARKLGVKLDDLLVSQPDTGEQALEIVDTLVRADAVDVIVVDSVAALVPRAEIEGEMGDSFVGLQARLMSQAMRKLTGSIARSNGLVLFINQIREKIGVMFGSPETTTGGRALKFYASIRCDIRRIGQIKEGEEVIGSRTKVTVVKNKIAPPFRKCEFDILFAQGISREGDLLDLGVENGAVQKSGTWLSFKHPKDGELRLGQGRERARSFLLENPDVTEELTRAVMAKAVAAPVAGATGGPVASPSAGSTVGSTAGPTAAVPPASLASSASAAPAPAAASASLRPVPKPGVPAGKPS